MHEATPPRPPPRPPLGVRGRAATLVFAGVLAVQVAVPALKLGSDGPARFGWQMFANVWPASTFTVEYVDGGVDTVRVTDYMAKPRPEIDLPTLLPPHLCGHLDGASAVSVHAPGPDGRTAVHPCR